MHLLLPTFVTATRLLDRVTLQEQFLSHITPISPQRMTSSQVSTQYKGEYDVYQNPWAAENTVGVESSIIGEPKIPVYTRSPEATDSYSDRACARQSLTMRNTASGAVLQEATHLDLSPNCAANEISTNLLIKDYAQICLAEATHQLCLKIDPSDTSLAVIYDELTLARRQIISISDNFDVNLQLLFIKSSGQFKVTCNGRDIFDISVTPDMRAPTASLSATGGAGLFSHVEYI